MDAPELEGYIVERRIGRGGMADVYRARQVLRNLPVAIKFLTIPDPRDNPVALHFLKTARVLARLNHPGVVRVYDFGTLDDGAPYIVTELLKGRSLRRRMLHGPIEAEEAVEIAGRALSALSYLHDEGLVHKDVKPENLYLNDDGGVKLLDLDLLDLEGETQIPEISKWFTREYASPEQIRRRGVDARSDLYSLGVVLYEMLAGHPPFRSEDPKEVIRLQLAATPPELSPDTNASLRAAAMRALVKDAEERFQSAEEMIAAIGWSPSARMVARDAEPSVSGPAATKRTIGDRASILVGALGRFGKLLSSRLERRPGDAVSAPAGARSIERVPTPHARTLTPQLSSGVDFSAAAIITNRAIQETNVVEVTGRVVGETEFNTLAHEGYATGVYVPDFIDQAQELAPEETLAAELAPVSAEQAPRHRASAWAAMLRFGKEQPVRETDMVHFSVAHPRALTPGGAYSIGVWIHLPEQREIVTRFANESQDFGDAHVKSKGAVPLERGSIVTVRMHAPDLVINDSEDETIWNGVPTNTAFVVSTPHDGPGGARPGLATFHVDGEQIAKFHFVMPVRSGALNEAKELK